MFRKIRRENRYGTGYHLRGNSSSPFAKGISALCSGGCLSGNLRGRGEANVALALSGFSVDAAFVSKVPAHEIGQSAGQRLRRYGVDTSKILRGGDRLGIYFLEPGASQRPSKVIYDRAGSAFALASPDEFDWKTIFSDGKWFHFSGITPLWERKRAADLS